MTPVDVQTQQAWVSGNGDGKPSWPTLDDPRVVRAMEEYMAALDEGQKPERQAFLAKHPDIAGALERCLGGLDFMHSAAAQLQSPGQEQASPHPGQIHAEGPLGDFRIVREVGRGGMGVVYEAVQISLGRRVALKVLPFASTLDPRHLQRFQNEARAAASLAHPNIVPVYGVGCERGVHYYAMRLIEGKPLDQLLEKERQKKKGPADPSRTNETRAQASTVQSKGNQRGYFRGVAKLALKAAETLEQAHQCGVIHRDIKPGNLLVDDQAHLWVTDFGLAQIQSDTRVTMTGDLVAQLQSPRQEQASALPAPMLPFPIAKPCAC